MAFGGIGFGGGTFGGAAAVAAVAAPPVWGPYLKSLYPDSHNVDGPVYSALLGAIGAMFDYLDPAQHGIRSEFSVTTASGSALDTNGIDWGVLRESGESDASYRSRILAALGVYQNGATDAGISGVITPFTGTAPTLYDARSDGWVWGSSDSPDNAWGGPAWYFSITIYVNNPSNTPYNHLNMESAIRRVLPSRSVAHLHHNGTDTSSAAEASNAIVDIAG